MLKIAVLAPMPSASVSTATAVRPGFFSNWRKANLRSFITKRDHRIDLGRPPRGQPGGEQRHSDHQERGSHKRYRLEWAQTEEARPQRPGHPKGERQAKADGDDSQSESGPEKQTNDLTASRAQGESDADFTGALGNKKRRDAEGSDHRQSQRQQGERAKQTLNCARRTKAVPHGVAHRDDFTLDQTGM